MTETIHFATIWLKRHTVEQISFPGDIQTDIVVPLPGTWDCTMYTGSILTSTVIRLIFYQISYASTGFWVSKVKTWLTKLRKKIFLTKSKRTELCYILIREPCLEHKVTHSCLRLGGGVWTGWTGTIDLNHNPAWAQRSTNLPIVGTLGRHRSCHYQRHPHCVRFNH